MQNLLRLTLLGFFAAVGVGLAIALATNPPAIETDPAAPFGNAALAAAETKATAPPAEAVKEPVAAAPLSAAPPAAVPAASTVAAAPQLVVPPSIVVPYQPPVTGQYDELKSNVEQLREATEAFKSASQHMLAQAQQAQVQPAQPAPSAPLAPALPLDEPVTKPAAKKAEPQIHPGEGDNGLVVNLQDADLRQVLETFSKQGNLNILASKSVEGTVSATLNGVDVNMALDAVLKSTGYVSRREGKFIYVGTPDELQTMTQVSDRLSTRVYRPNYVKAADIQALITPLLTKGVGVMSVSAPSEVDIPADSVKTGGNNLAGQDVVLVRDYERVLERVDQLIAEVDQAPRQVAIEAMILSVNLNDSVKVGVDFALLRDNDHTRLISGSPLEGLDEIPLNSGGLKFGYLDSSVAVFINALETVGDTNVVAAPRLMCLNKQKAEILIGEQLGYVSTTVTENSATQSIDFLEVGTQLRFRPYISGDGMIRLEVHPELSEGSVTVDSGFTLPNKKTTQVTTNIMCRDGCTVVIGGLIRESVDDQRSQTPWLGSLPWVGPAFRHRDTALDRSEVIVLLTPHIVCDDLACKEGDTLACDFDQRREALLNASSPVSKRYMGRRQLGLAKAAWSAGKQHSAEHHLKLAMFYDPANLDIIRFRNEMLSAGTFDGCPPSCTTPWQNMSGEGVGSPSVVTDCELVPPGVPTPAMGPELPRASVPNEEARRAPIPRSAPATSVKRS